MNIATTDKRIDPMFIKLCRVHPEMVKQEQNYIIDSLCRKHKPRVRVKAISRKAA